MIDAIVAQLKTGTIKNVVPFPYGILPSPPYIVVKEEPQPDFGRTQYRIIVHMAPGQILPLRKYVRKDVFELLNDKRLTSAYLGCTNLVQSSLSVDNMTVENDDKTISQERLFYVREIF